MMSTRSIAYLELQSLLSSLCDDQISDEGRRRLFEILEADPEARRFYIDCLDLDASLRWHCADLGGERPKLDSTPASDGGILRSGIVTFLGDAFRAGGEFLSRSLVLTLLLAVGLPLVILVLLVIDMARQPVARAPVANAPVAKAPAAKAPAPAPAAEVTDSLGCVLAEGGADLPAGTKLFSGQPLQLKEGLAELTFAGGATAVLQGPATFRVDSRHGGRLDDGSVAATVPPRARGFAIETPFARVVDFGTEFGILVAPDGRAETHVFLGEVEVAAKTNASQAALPATRLRKGEAVEVRAGQAGQAPQLVAMRAVAERFVRHMPERVREKLPEPTVIFSHYGSKNPTRESWRRRGVRETGIEVGPVEEDGVPAWSIRTAKDNQIVYYVIDDASKLTPALLAEAREKGWVLRARVWLSERSKIPPEKRSGVASFSYRDGKRGWTIRPSVDADGKQCVMIFRGSSLGVDAVVPIPGSRNRYVDYEVRYRPRTGDAEVFINGRRVATWFRDDSGEEYTSPPQIRFGGWRPAIDARFALVEWGILRGSPTTTDPNKAPNQGENGALPPADVHQKSDKSPE